MKKTYIYIGIVVVVLFLLMIFVFSSKKSATVQNPTGIEDITMQNPVVPEPIEMCYKYSSVVSSGFTDNAFLKMKISGSKVTGEYKNLPAEKDSKVGAFEGSVGPMDPTTSSRLADVWWSSSAEGMNVTEQLHIKFGEGSAMALFGEMVDRGDGVYVYKDVSALSPGFQMSQTDCESLDLNSNPNPNTNPNTNLDSNINLNIYDK